MICYCFMRELLLVLCYPRPPIPLAAKSPPLPHAPPAFHLPPSPTYLLSCPLPGVIPGSNFKVPFKCPMDHVFDLEGGFARDLPADAHGPNVEFK